MPVLLSHYKDHQFSIWLASAKPWHILTQVPKVTLLSGTGFYITTILFGLLSEKSKQKMKRPKSVSSVIDGHR